MSLTPNSALGASVSSTGETQAGVLPPGTPIPLQALHFAQGSLGGEFTSAAGIPTSLNFATGGQTLPPASSSGGVASQKESGNLPRDGSNNNLTGTATSSEATSTRSNPTSAPCGACKFLRRKCTNTCVFAAHFQPDQSPRFASVHKIFGASNVAKWLQELPAHSRDDAVNSLCYEADARIKDPVYGCVGALFALQQQVVRLQAESAAAQAELARLRALAASQSVNGGPGFSPSNATDTLSSRLSTGAPQLPMIPSFAPSSMAHASGMMMNTLGGFDHSALPSSITMPMYNTQGKPGPGMGGGLLPQSTPSMPLYSLTSGSQSFSSPPLSAQGMIPLPPSLKLSPQSMGSLHGVPSTCSTSNLGHAGLDSPAQRSLRTKRLKPEQGSPPEGLAGFPILEALPMQAFQDRGGGYQDPSHFVMTAQQMQPGMHASAGLRQR